MRFAFVAVFYSVCLIGVLGGSWEALSWVEHQLLSPRTTKPALTESGSLTEFGIPVAHEIVGPFHVLQNKGYISGYDAGIQDPRWVETRFFAVSSPISKGRPSEFSPDFRIEPENQVNTHYWTGTGYDRGHMAPNWGVSICYGRSAQLETFLVTNIVPQTPALNRGLWETLEKIISNDYANRFGQVWVICGPIFGPKCKTLKEGKVLIPDECYKIVLRIDADGQPHTLAWEIPQNLRWEHNQQDLLQYLTSVDRVEKDTGILFFPHLPNSKGSDLTSTVSKKMW